jgi:hypothetical protein
VLKSIVLNQKKLPVPIPVRTLGEALNWVENHLQTKDQCLTKVVLNRKSLDLETLDPKLKLNEQTFLELRLDSVDSLCIQSLEAIQNLLIIAEREQKDLVIQLWDFQGLMPQSLKNFLNDLDLVVALIQQVNLFLEQKQLLAMGEDLQTIRRDIEVFKRRQDWREIVSVIINRLSRIYADLAREVTSLESEILSR